MWNPWKHLRIAGGFTTLAGALMHHSLLMVLGLLVQYIGALGAIDLLERRIDLLTPKEEDNGNDR